MALRATAAQTPGGAPAATLPAAPDGASPIVAGGERTSDGGTALGGARRLTEEGEIYRRVRSGVFIVEGETGFGSGFLVDRAGLVLTNAHVVKGSREVRVQVDAARKVRADLLYVDARRDVAVLRIHPDACRTCAVLSVRLVPGANGLAQVGERVLAIGSPLNQRGVLTTGVVSQVEDGALISDVNINHGNSGGPLLTLDGTVVAINTFGDFTRSGGPGLSGSILVTEAADALRHARDSTVVRELPSAELLPVAPRRAYPVTGLENAARRPRWDLSLYSAELPRFSLSIGTPLLEAWLEAQNTARVTARRQKREAKRGIGENESVNSSTPWHAWEEYVGRRRPVVAINARPKIGQTGGSLFANMLGAFAAGYTNTYYVGHYTYEFKSDVRDVRLMRDGAPVPAITRFRQMLLRDVQGQYIEMADVAHQGLYEYAYEVFAPDSTGRFPTMELVVEDASGRLTSAFLNPATVRQIWSDFAPYRLDVETGRPGPSVAAAGTSSAPLGSGTAGGVGAAAAVASAPLGPGAGVPSGSPSAAVPLTPVAGIGVPEAAAVTIVAQPWANLMIDGAAAGAAPSTHVLRAGKHTLSLRRDGFAPLDVPITVVGGRAQALAFTLSPVRP